MVCFHFVSSFTTVMAVPILNCLHACRKQGKILLYHLIQLRPWSTRKAKIAFPLLLTSNFSLKSRENHSAELLVCFSLYPHDQKGHDKPGTRKTFISVLSSSCLFAPCCPAKGVTLLYRGPQTSSFLLRCCGNTGGAPGPLGHVWTLQQDGLQGSSRKAKWGAAGWRSWMSAKGWPRTYPVQWRREGALPVVTLGITSRRAFSNLSPVLFWVNIRQHGANAGIADSEQETV